MPAQRVGLGSAAPTQCSFGACTHEAAAEGSTDMAAPERWQCCMALPSRKTGHRSTVVSPKCEDLVVGHSMAVLYRFTNFHGLINTRLLLQTFILWHGKWDQSRQILETFVLELCLNEISRSNYDFSVSNLFTGGLKQAGFLFRLFDFSHWWIRIHGMGQILP